MASHRASCQCGSLVLEADVDPDMVSVCNCRACQKRSGSPFGVGAFFRKDAVTITGARQSWVRRAASGREIQNQICPTCGTTLCWSGEMRPDHIGVPVGVLDTIVQEPARAVWASKKHPWVSFPADWPTYPENAPQRP
ncbi:MAG: aldehyde-activating protein [Boseongicola sp.]|nr:MAG: aldehyde-activating protein [Boseongicola sp.]